MKRKSVTVLDLGSTKVACAAFDLSGPEPVLMAAASDSAGGLRRGSVTDPQAAAGAIDAAVKKVQLLLATEITDLVIGIGGQQVFGARGKGYLPIYPRNRTITREDVLQVINHSRQGTGKDRVQLQAIPGGFAVDGRGGVKAPIGVLGSKLEVDTYIVAADAEYLKNVEKAVGLVGKKVDQMVLRPLASGLAVLSAEEKEGSVAIDIGGGTTELAVFIQGSLVYHGSIPIGGQAVTSDLSKLLKTSMEEAERLKVDFGQAQAKGIEEEDSVDVIQLGQTHKRPLQRRVLCEIVESRMRELALMVRQHIENSGCANELSAGVVLTGGGSQLAGTVELFEEVLEGVRVRTGKPHIAGPDAGVANNPAFSTAVGLALFVGQGYDDELSPASGSGDWKDRIGTLWSLVSGRA